MKHRYIIVILSIAILLIPSAIGEDNAVVKVTASSTDCSEPGSNFTVTIEVDAKEDGNYSVKLKERPTKYKFVDPADGEKYDEDIKAGEKRTFDFELISNASNLDPGSTFLLEYQVYKDGYQVAPGEQGEFETVKIKVKEKIDDDDGFIPGFGLTFLIMGFIVSCLIFQKKHKV